jgi:hypothetical protein
MEYLCELCKTSYKTNKTLLNHNNKFHNDENKMIFKCPHCDSKFTRKNNMVAHIKTKCKNNEKQITIEKQLLEMQKKIEELENKSITTTNNTKNINNGTINKNNTINNIIYINKTGTENHLELNDNETKEIFSKEITSVVSLIKFINFNERLPSNHSFCTKSLEGKYLLTYNTEESKIESTRKKYFYQELLSTAVDKLELLYKACKNKFTKEKQSKIEDTINRLKEIKERDYCDKILIEIKNQLIQLSYNCRNIVLSTWDNNMLESKDIIKKIEECNMEKEFTDKELDEFNQIFLDYKDTNENSESSDTPIDIFKKNKKKTIKVTTSEIEI